MKKRCLINVCLCLVTMMSYSCSENIDISEEKETVEVSQETYILAKNKLRGVFAQIKESAWDGNSLDIPAFEAIIQKETGWTNEYIYELENTGLSYTRSETDPFGMLSDGQKELLEFAQNYFMQKRFISDNDIKMFENKAKDLPLKEKQEFMSGPLIAKLTQDVAQDEFTMRRSFSFESLLCNMTTGGIGTLWGEMAGGVAIACGATAAVAGGVGFAVCLVGGALLSTVAC